MDINKPEERVSLDLMYLAYILRVLLTMYQENSTKFDFPLVTRTKKKYVQSIHHMSWKGWLLFTTATDAIASIVPGSSINGSEVCVNVPACQQT